MQLSLDYRCGGSAGMAGRMQRDLGFTGFPST